MNKRLPLFLAAGMLAGCAGPAADTSEPAPARTGRVERVETTRGGTLTAGTIESYKRDLAERISSVNSTKVYAGRPQALLRSVVVVKYVVDAHGNLVRSEIMRSNHDRHTESTALASLRSAAPFPKPEARLLRRGQLELAETWLFNNDGRFQLRSIAEPQMDE